MASKYDELHGSTNDSGLRVDTNMSYRPPALRPLHTEKRKLRIAIITENIMPKVDGVTRCLARLLAHLRENGHEAVVLGPNNGMVEYETHPLVGTAGIPLVLYPGLKLNFMRPLFLRTISEFNPDVIHVVEPIWLGAQVLMAMELGWCGPEWQGADMPGLGRGVGGAVVCSYHTNLPTYATLFGLPWLEPIMWRWVRWLHKKCLLTACPSQSSIDMLKEKGLESDKLRLWPRGVDLSLFGPHQRRASLRERWGVRRSHEEAEHQECTPLSPLNLPDGVVPPLTPPPSPDLLPMEETQRRNEGVVILYVGRISYEKNLLLLISAFEILRRELPSQTSKMKLVFVGDGPARSQLEEVCKEKAIDACFEGHQSGIALAERYASADIFAFPSYTETFGQVVLEALASGLPVVGLDAAGTRDLVSHNRTGLLLPKPKGKEHLEWCYILSPAARRSSPLFAQCAQAYADLLSTFILDRKLQASMRKRAVDEGTVGRTWNDAMESLVDQYREAIAKAEQARDPSSPKKVPGPTRAWLARRRRLGTPSTRRTVYKILALSLIVGFATWCISVSFF